MIECAIKWTWLIWSCIHCYNVLQEILECYILFILPPFIFHSSSWMNRSLGRLCNLNFDSLNQSIPPYKLKIYTNTSETNYNTFNRKSSEGFRVSTKSPKWKSIYIVVYIVASSHQFRIFIGNYFIDVCFHTNFGTSYVIFHRNVVKVFYRRQPEVDVYTREIL